MHCHVVVNKSKRFLDVYVGMPDSVNNSRALKRSTLYCLVKSTNLFNPNLAQEDFAPYFLENKGYLCLPWLITPHREVASGNCNVQEQLFNRKMSRGKLLVENAFGILKQCFQELK